MVEHTIRSSYQPTIEVMINGKQTNSLAIDVALELKIEALVLEIKNARIMAVRPGDFTASGSVTWRETELKKLESSPFELPGRQALCEGVEIPLLDGGHHEVEPGRGAAVGLPAQPQDPPNRG